jgi:hypothetical protein
LAPEGRRRLKREMNRGEKIGWRRVDSLTNVIIYSFRTYENANSNSSFFFRVLASITDNATLFLLLVVLLPY